MSKFHFQLNVKSLNEFYTIIYKNTFIIFFYKFLLFIQKQRTHLTILTLRC